MSWRAAVPSGVLVFAVACGGDVLAPTAPSPSSPADATILLPETADVPEFGWATAHTGLLASVDINPSVLVGGESTRATVTLHEPAPAGGLTLSVTADDASATVPSTVTAAQGATSATFTITTKAVSSDVRIGVAVSAGTSSLTTLMRITPLVTVKSLTVADARITGGNSTTGTVTLSAANTRGATVVSLESERNDDVRVPASITIASGSSTGTFTVETRDITADEETWIHARVGATTRRSVQVRVVPSKGTASGGLSIRAVID
jgi:hypothetical protein